MRVRILTGLCLLTVASLVLAEGAWGEKFEDLYKEMAETPPPMGTKHMMWVPLVLSENTGASLTDLCVSGDTVRRKPDKGPSDNMGKVSEGNQYTVLIMALSPAGDTVFRYHRKVSLPPCQ